MVTVEEIMRALESGVIMEQKGQVFEADEDAYDGMNVHIKESMDSNHFITKLRASITQWTKQGKTAVWIKLPIEHANLVNAAVKEGFWYHHAEPTYLMLVYWIPQTPNTIPANASHRVGVGALVINDNGEVLVVQEKNGTFRGTGVWKLPTGVVDEGEGICDAAVREVNEETGIRAEFVELLAFRQSHKSFFGKSDLFFVCMLKPLSYKIQKQDSEIEGAQWMPMEEYAAQPFVKKHEMFNKIAEICLAKKDNKYSGFSNVLMTSGFSAKRSYLYFNQKQFTLPQN
ncbi:nudix hydrolase 2-like isoform X1 [Lycium barbarum]|uniref:nudix hydrolase 2-like isoform X1 n=1 Tax=Lycium barbarum TaxID=112863 RepID=UPI00293E5219|nr:nudix hydrolase 2-like isoform X1 [Lycium barbarum]